MDNDKSPRALKQLTPLTPRSPKNGSFGMMPNGVRNSTPPYYMNSTPPCNMMNAMHMSQMGSGQNMQNGLQNGQSMNFGVTSQLAGLPHNHSLPNGFDNVQMPIPPPEFSQYQQNIPNSANSLNMPPTSGAGPPMNGAAPYYDPNFQYQP